MNYKKIYSQALKTVLGGRKGVVLKQFTESADGKDLLTFDNYGLFFIPKELNIFAEHVGASLSAHDVCKFIPKEDTVLTTLQPTSTVIGKRPCGRALEKPDGSEYQYLLDDSYFGYFNRDAEIKVNLAAKTSVFYIFENDELVCVVAPIRQKK
ncbi:MAG: hypothetical protein UCM69_03675 [Dialister invisus]|nr:hypothetical protein [Dialister invisus]